MSHATQPERSIAPHSALDADDVRAAYRRWARVYDASFGSISAFARRRAIDVVNRLPGTQVLEMGVGTGLALPHYTKDKRVIGIDLSAEMLVHARTRVLERNLTNVDALLELDAEATGFEEGRFDIAVAMFVASVVPHPRQLLAEMRRVVRPGGHILFINHFAAERGPRWWVERALAPASRALGWHPDFAVDALFPAADRQAAKLAAMPPLGLFTLAQLTN
jgi:phosphatidylethanolamine/phosphatidyl-N-methylethanolamine N-methyltransferase